ncbi:MAG: TolC family protein [Candidatus Solibacter sp.]|nr:TolC family protein [Candidatus Solibacter sp.]
MKTVQVISIFVLAAGSLAAQPAGAPDQVTVEQAVQEAVERNLNLLAERYNLSIADARIITAKLRPNPVVSAGLDYVDFLRAFSHENQGGPTEYNLRTDFTLERGGKRDRRIEVARTSREVAQLQLLNTTRTLVLDVQNAFVDVQQAKDNLALARENLQAFQSIVEVNATRLRAGDLAKVELVRTQVAALQFQSAVRLAESKLKVAGNKLQSLMGRTSPSPSFDVVGALRRDADPVVLETVDAQAAEMRPDLLALRKDQARSLAEIRSQMAQGKVDFTVGTEYHREFHNGNANALGFFFSAPLPVWNRNQGEIERARQEQEQIKARIRAAEADVRNEVRNAWVQYATSRGLLESIEHDLLEQAREVRTTMEYSYRRGEASLVEFLDAQRAFNDARQSTNDARADFARSLYTIDAISGRAVR